MFRVLTLSGPHLCGLCGGRLHRSRYFLGWLYIIADFDRLKERVGKACRGPNEKFRLSSLHLLRLMASLARVTSFWMALRPAARLGVPSRRGHTRKVDKF